MTGSVLTIQHPVAHERKCVFCTNPDVHERKCVNSKQFVVHNNTCDSTVVHHDVVHNNTFDEMCVRSTTFSCT